MRALIASALVLVAVPALADREVVHRINVASAVRGVRRVTIAIPAGEIDIRNGAANRISVDGSVRLRYDGRHHDAMQQVVDDVSVAVDIDGDHATIYRIFGPNAGSWRARHMSAMETTIEVPPGVAVDVETHFGEVRMDGAFGDIEADLRAGEFVLRTPRSNIRSLDASVLVGEVHTNLGDRVMSREGVFPGHTRFEGTGRSNANVHVTAGEVHVTLTR